MRELSLDDLRWVAGGLPSSGSEGEIVVENGRFYQWLHGSWEEVVEPVEVSPSQPDPNPGPEWPDPEIPDPDPPIGGGPVSPNCGNTDAVTMITAPDNATYYAPEGVNNLTIINAINHLQAIPNLWDRLVEFKSMYEDKTNPYFIDFKKWGLDEGPTGSQFGGMVTYFSAEKGANHTGTAFEAFGNYTYGFVGMLGGIPQEALLYVAGLVQTGNNWGERLLGMDGPEDRPHVMKGIMDAISYMNLPHTVLNIVDTHCN